MAGIPTVRPVVRMCRIAVMAALLCAAAPWSVPIGPVPLSLGTFAVYLIGLVLGCTDGTIAVAVYLLLGALGVPVFTGFAGGIQKLLGPTGGYLVGYIPCVAIVGFAADRCQKSGDPKRVKAVQRFVPLFAMLIGTALLYALGTAWFVFQSGRTLTESLTLCVLPFLPGDAAKITVALLAGIPLRRMTDKLLTASKSVQKEP